MEKFSVDLPFAPSMNILQPENGYRFSTDSIILAAHVCAENKDSLIDIGTGCGILPLILAARYPNLHITGIEVQEQLCRFACKNVSNNGLENQVRIINEDINKIEPDNIQGPADLIISNPPYKKQGSGRLNPNSQKAIARHEILLTVNQLFKYSNTLLKKNGAIYLIFPADRLEDLRSAMKAYAFSPSFIRFIHTKAGLPPKRVVLCASKNGHQACITKPALCVCSSSNQYTDEYLDLIHSSFNGV